MTTLPRLATCAALAATLTSTGLLAANGATAPSGDAAPLDLLPAPAAPSLNSAILGSAVPTAGLLGSTTAVNASLALQGVEEWDEDLIEYDYVWGRAVLADGETLDDGAGLNLEFAHELSDVTHFYGDVDYVNFDDAPGSGEVDLLRWTAGLGVQTPSRGPLSGYARAGYGSREYDGFGVASDDGLFLSAGLRFLVSETFEFEARYSYVGSQPHNDGLRLGATLQLGDNLGLGAAYEFSDELRRDLDVIYAGLRWSF